jgi:hypothetical protein
MIGQDVSLYRCWFEIRVLARCMVLNLRLADNILSKNRVFLTLNTLNVAKIDGALDLSFDRGRFLL